MAAGVSVGIALLVVAILSGSAARTDVMAFGVLAAVVGLAKTTTA